jgi:hypothetical protein
MWIPVIGLALGACAGAGATSPPAAPSAPVEAASTPRMWHVPSDQELWVEHTASIDRWLSHGVRLECAASGEITAAAWDLDRERYDPLQGSFAIPARLGGGFLHWTRAALYRSQTFTGPLARLTHEQESPNFRGARAGLSSVLVFADDGPRELLPGAAALRPFAEPGVLDLAAVSDRRAAKLDVFGHLTTTEDGGRTQIEVASGMSIMRLAPGPGEIHVDAQDARFTLRPGGALDLDQPTARGYRDNQRGFEIAWLGPRTREREHVGWTQSGYSPLAAAVAAGAGVGDGTAFGVVQNSIVRVDLGSGRLVSVTAEAIPNALTCSALRAPDAVLFACTWERYQSYGGYVLRSVAGEAPTLERAFSDDGSFVAGDDGSLGFLGSCSTKPRYFDAEEQSQRYNESMNAEPVLSDVFCARRGPGDWVEHRVELVEGEALTAWIPGSGGRAAAITLAGAPLPAPHTARATVRGGVQVVQIDRDVGGWGISRSNGSDRGARALERRFFLREDGSLDAWLNPTGDSFPAEASVGATIDPRGQITVHPAAPGMVSAVVGGAFGLAIGRDGDLFESLDHGRTYRAAGRSPVSRQAAQAGSQSTCSELGCTLGPLVRVGWGEARAEVAALHDPPSQPAPPAPKRRLSCSPAGAPVPLASTLPAGRRHTAIATPWGDSLELVRDTDDTPRPPPAAKGSPKVVPAVPAPPPSPVPPAKKPAPRPSTAVLRTHTLLVRPPFAPRAAPRKLNATDASALERHQGAVTPLLAASGEVQLLIAADDAELLVSGDRLTRLSRVEGRRWSRSEAGAPGGLIEGDKPLMLVDGRRRVMLESPTAAAGSGALSLSPILEMRRRPVTMGRRDDGAVGILVLDGPAPVTVGVSLLDRLAAGPGPVLPLAPWSSLLTADDPRCKPEANRDALRALVAIDAAAWLELDPTTLPATPIGRRGLMQVRWGKERVCLEALDVAVEPRMTRPRGRGTTSLVARWAGEGEKGAALRASDLRQDLTCALR